MKKINYKLWLSAALATSALALSACAQPESATTQDDVDPVADPQTQVEQEATGVDDVDQVESDTESVDTSNDPLVNKVPGAEANDGMLEADEIGGGDNTVIDDSEILDGTETEEHVSTY